MRRRFAEFRANQHREHVFQRQPIGVWRRRRLHFGGSAPEAQLSAVTFEDNQSAGRGGAISFDDVDAKITLKFGEFRGNRADFGGALAITQARSRHPELHASAVSFKNNVSAQTGAALFVNGAIVQNSRGIFVENKPETGGTLSFKGGLTPAFTLGNLLIARNTGAIALDGASGDLVNSTIAENDGVGIQIAGNVRLSNSVIAKNANLNCRFAGSGAVLTNKGSNLQFPDNSCGAAIGSADPLLDSFYVPDPASPLQGAGEISVCAGAPVFNRDVYGQRRPRSAHSTVGAVEGDIDQLIHHIGLGGGQPPPGGGPGPGGSGTPRPGPGTFDLTICCLLLLLLALLLLALIAVVYILWKRQRNHDAV